MKYRIKRDCLGCCPICASYELQILDENENIIYTCDPEMSDEEIFAFKEVAKVYGFNLEGDWWDWEDMESEV